jgi:uncharacterized protein YbjT (DUF2867 family)
MKALIIGATGYVGSAVARNFKAHGYETHGLARNAQNVAALEVVGVVPVEGDLDDLSRVATLSKGYDLTVLAGLGQRDQESAAVSAFIEACRGSSAGPARMASTPWSCARRSSGATAAACRFRRSSSPSRRRAGHAMWAWG